MVLPERLLVFAVLEELVAHLADVARDLERGLGAFPDVLAVDGVLVFGVVLVHVAVCRCRLGERRVIRRELTAFGDDAWFDRDVAARRLSVFDRAHDGLAADDLAEDDVLAVEMGRGVASDEELRAVRVRARVGLAFAIGLNAGVQYGKEEFDVPSREGSALSA